MHSSLLDLPPRPLKHFYHHISPSFITSLFSIIASSLFTIICTIVCTIKKFHQTNPSKEIHFCTIIFSIKKFHQRKSIFALSFFPSRNSIKGNPFLHYQVFHQNNPSYALSKNSITTSSFFSINFFHHY